MAKKLVVANWKMAPESLKEAQDLFRSYLDLELKNVDLIVAPPFDYTEKLTEIPYKKSGIKFGAQDVFYENPSGAYTGEISAKMLKDADVKYVIVGHSERRRFLNESDQIVNKKMLASVKGGLVPVLCVGENVSVRNKGRKTVENFIKSQLEKDLRGIGKTAKLIVAYEPVWAIGTGNEDAPQDALEIIIFIKKLLVKNHKLKAVKILYGGSVDSQNIGNFLQYKDIDGALVGGSSVNKKEFAKLIKKI